MGKELLPSIFLSNQIRPPAAGEEKSLTLTVETFSGTPVRNPTDAVVIEDLLGAIAIQRRSRRWNRPRQHAETMSHTSEGGRATPTLSDCAGSIPLDNEQRLLHAIDDTLSQTAEKISTTSAFMKSLVRDYKPRLLSAEARQRLAETSYFSPSSLERFSHCPFAYFLEFVLELRPPHEFDFTPMNEGIIYHKVLHDLYREIADAPPGKKRLPEKKFFVERGIELLRAQLDNVSPATIAEAEKRRIFNFLELFLQEEFDFQSLASSTPSVLEVGFGRKEVVARARDPRSKEKYFLIEIPGQSPARVSGVIDRIDTFPQSQRCIVIDYKRKETKEVRRQIHELKDIQLLLHMLAAEDVFDMEPVAGFYCSVRECKRRGIFDVERFPTPKKSKMLLKADGVPSCEFTSLLARVREHIANCVARLRQADISISPCDRDWCDYRAICRV